MQHPNPARARKVHKRIAAWYRKHRRALTWRKTFDPYTILVSEIMLQQTQVSRVQAKLPFFLKRFPTVRKLAKASPADVLRAWSGMGYNNRAVRLREIARTIVSRHNGRIPSSPETLRTMPGIGPYTAHAVACFAFNKRVPLVDVNIRRVLSRLFGRMNSPGSVMPGQEAWTLAEQILPRGAYSWNQALMDFGAMICTARVPLCSQCPVASLCLSRGTMVRTRRSAPSIHKNRLRQEPLHQGVPNRYWRGRIVEALRRTDHTNPLTLLRLGKAIKNDFHPREMVWLSNLLDALRKDRIIEVHQANGRTKVRLAGG